MKKYTALAAALLIGGTTLSVMAAGNSTAGVTHAGTHRGELVHSIVMRWGASVHEFTKSDVRTWARLMGPLFAKASTATLQKAANAKTFQTMENVLVGIPTTDALGSTTSDLIFMPIVPCRILDTRPAFGGTGPLAAGETRQFDVTATGGSYAFQGGSPTDCGGLGSGEEAPAVVVNFTTVLPVGAGYITAWPTDGSAVHPKPTAATVNYAGGDIRGNLSIIQLDLGATNELSVYSLRATNVVGDAVGYFIRPQATALACTDEIATGTATNGLDTFNSYPSCQAGYTATGGYCYGAQGVAGAYLLETGANGCVYRNNSGADFTMTMVRTCCQVPGR